MDRAGVHCFRDEGMGSIEHTRSQRQESISTKARTLVSNCPEGGPT